MTAESKGRFPPEILFLACTVILVLNDHYLKGLYGNVLTGKLSDLVGPFVLYRLLCGVGGVGLSGWLAAIITLLFAVAIKLSQGLADLVAQATCGVLFEGNFCRLVADPTDLFAYLPFLGFSLALWGRTLRRSSQRHGVGAKF